MTTADPEFTDEVPSKPKSGSGELAARLVRPTLYAHAVAALMTASYDILYVARFRGLIGWDDLRQWDSGLESLGGLTFLTAYLFPFLIASIVSTPGFDRRERWRAVVATLALVMFQCFAILPAIQ